MNTSLIHLHALQLIHFKLRQSLLSIILCFSITSPLLSQACSVTVPGGMSFNDVNDLETFLNNQTVGMTCSEIEITGSITMNCSTSPTSLIFTGPNIDKVTSISINFEINFCSSVTMIDGFLQLKTIGRNFQISNNTALTQIGDFPQLTSVDGFFQIFQNRLLTQIGDFLQFNTLGTNFDIRSNLVLTQIGDFPELCFVNGFFQIEDNIVLSQIGDFSQLSFVGARFDIMNNDGLTQIDNFTQLSYVGQNLEISLNDALTQIDDFTQLCSVGGSFIIQRNEALTQIGDFSQLCSIGGAIFSISLNPVLTQIGDFSQLCSVAVDFIILSNPELTQIGDFSNLCTVGSRFILRSNTLLSSCCTFKPILSSGNISGIIDIRLNLANCNDEAEILDVNICSEPNPTASCKSDFTINLNSCGTACLTVCALVDGPCCGFTASLGGEPIVEMVTLSCDDIGTHMVELIDDEDNSCMVMVNLNDPSLTCGCMALPPVFEPQGPTIRN